MPSEYTFEVAPTVDITKLPLSPEEGVVVARMLGRRVTLADLVREAVVPSHRVNAVVEALIRKGAVIRVGGAKNASEHDPYEGIIFSAVDLAEAADITEEQKKRILFVEMHLGVWSHYKLLGIKKTAPAADIKQGYFRASKEFHPDAYFRKNLGSYKDRVDRIFRAMKNAYDVLSDDKQRAVYDDNTIIELSPEEEAEIEVIQEKKRQAALAKERDERNEQRKKEARLKRNPALERIKRGRELLSMAEESAKAGRTEEAANHARMAVSFDESLRAKAGPLILAADKARAQAMAKRLAQVLSSPVDTRDMEAELNRVADEAAEIAVQCADAGLLVEVSRALMTLKRPVKAAKLAHQATEVEPRDVKTWEALAEAAAADKKWAILLRASERWLQLDAKNARAKELHKEAKRNS